MAEKTINIEEIIDELNGTCESLDTILERHGIEYDDLKDHHFSRIDNDIFQCTTCGWWCDQSENHEHPDSGEWICRDCFDEIDSDQ